MRSIKYTIGKGKDESPINTIAKIQSCFRDIGFTCGISFYAQEVAGCYSARVYLEGALSDTISANGKGTSIEYCIASGFAELMERIQNQIFPCQIPFDTLETMIRENPLPAHSLCRYESLAAMRKNKNSFLNRIVKKYTDSIKEANGYDKELLVWMQLDQLFPFWKSVGVLTVPFYHVQTGQYEWLPIDLIKSVNLSNGMAAGNTLEEALVQGYSEVFERYAQRQILLNEITPPALPEQELQKYPEILKTIRQIEQAGPYHVIIKDCSLGIGLPVVCGIIIHKEEQTFGVRFGAHPDLQIALERIFTEAMQGKSLDTFSRYNQISFQQENVCSQQNIFNLLKTGSGLYPPSLLSGKESYPHTPWNRKEAEFSNQTLALQMTEQILGRQKKLYIADVSYLGFPSVLIYAEDMSEIIPTDYAVLKSNVLKNEAMNFLKMIDSMNRQQAERLLKAGELLRGAVLENVIPAMCRMPLSAFFHGGHDQIGFMMVVCHYYLGNDSQAAKLLKQCIMTQEKGSEEYAYEKTLLKFLQALSTYKDIHKAEEILYNICDKNIALQVLSDFGKRSQVFAKLYPACKQMQCNACSVTGCAYDAFKDFYETLYRKMTDSSIWCRNLHQILSGERYGDKN